MRARNDQKNLFFISNKGRKLFEIVRRIFSEKKIEEIFNWRLQLSDDFDNKVSTGSYDQIIELAAGYSLRGFSLCLKNKNISYIDSDFEDVTSKKNDILKIICKKENIIYPDNYSLAAINILEDNIFSKLQNIVSKNKKTLIIAEGLTSYFNESEFDKFIKNIKNLLSNFYDGEFFSHENIAQPTKGMAYYLLRKIFVSFLTKTRGRSAFKTTKEFEDYIKGKKVDKFKITLDKHGHLLYSIYS
jgi:O-methyltransferase involved in polyketide biosynthesis